MTLASGQYDGPGEYCGLSTASDVFIILIVSRYSSTNVEPAFLLYDWTCSGGIGTSNLVLILPTKRNRSLILHN